MNFGILLILSEIDISNKLNETFSKHSSSENYNDDFRRTKNQKEKTKLGFKSKKLENHIKPFS